MPFLWWIKPRLRKANIDVPIGPYLCLGASENSIVNKGTTRAQLLHLGTVAQLLHLGTVDPAVTLFLPKFNH